jgi:hypothetical protein
MQFRPASTRFGHCQQKERQMIRTISLAAALAAAAAAPAAAQTWGFGVAYGSPDYYGPAPDYYYYDAPVLYEPVPPPAYFEGAPIEVAPDGRPVFHMEAPDDVLDDLADAGFREFGPMHMRGHYYSVAAVDPRGDLVHLKISIFTGEIDQVTLIQEGVRPRRAPPQPVVAAAPPPPPPAPQAAPAPTPPPPAATPPSSLRDRLIPPPEEQDPLVVY